MNYEYVLDSYAWAEFFDGTKQGAKVKVLLDNYRIATSVIALAELSDKCSRENRDFQPLVLLTQKGTAHHRSETGGMLASLGAVPLECQCFPPQPVG